MCKYTKDEQQAAPYPRVEYTAQCGFRLCIMEGYEVDTQTDSLGNQFQTRSTRLVVPSGKCMQCGENITVKTENLELEGSDVAGDV